MRDYPKQYEGLTKNKYIMNNSFIKNLIKDIRVFVNSTNHKYIGFTLLGIFIFGCSLYVPHVYTAVAIFLWLILIVYSMLYTWRELPMSFSSYLAFSGNMIILSLYTLGLLNLMKGLPNPIYIENLSTFSYYRYMVFLGAALIAITFYFLFKLGVIPSSWQSKTSLLTFPYLKEEFRIVLDSFNPSGSMLIRITNKLIESLVIRYVFFSIHFLLFYCFRFLCLSLFIRYVFYHGDLRYLIYLLPISFLIWLLRFLDYSYFYFVQATENSMKDLLIIESLTPLTPEELSSTFITRNGLIFTLTDFAIKEGYTRDHVIDRWLTLLPLRVTITKYKKYSDIFSKIFLIFYVFAWFSITSDNTSILSGFGLFFRRTFSSTRPLLAPPRDWRYMKEPGPANDLKQKTGGAYGPGHPVYGEQQADGTYRADGQLTKGAGTKEYPSQDLGIPAPNGKQQNYIPFDTPVVLKPGDVNAPIPGSEALLEKPEVKAKLDQYSSKE